MKIQKTKMQIIEIWKCKKCRCKELRYENTKNADAKKDINEEETVKERTTQLKQIMRNKEI